MSNQITVAAVQMDCVLGDKNANLAKAEKFIAQASGHGAKLVVVPELFSTGYRLDEDYPKHAEPIPGETTARLTEIAKKYDVYIIGAILEKGEDGVVYDTAVAIGAEGLLGKYRKMHLWGNESKYFGRGNTLCVVKLPFATVGLQICYEIGFPEQARVLTQMGADIIVYTSAFGKARAYAWDVASRSRALENGAYVIACNRVGTELDTVLGGLSRIVAPNTDVIAGVGADCESIVCADIDLDFVPIQRRTIPYLRDLNKNLIIKPF